jgi:hypothetical protein
VQRVQAAKDDHTCGQHHPGICQAACALTPVGGVMQNTRGGGGEGCGRSTSRSRSSREHSGCVLGRQAQKEMWQIGEHAPSHSA